jgi:hypothetical protein
MYLSYSFLFQTNLFGRDSVVFIVTALRAGRPGVRIPVTGVLLALKNIQTGPGAQQASHFNEHRVSFPGVNWSERDVYQLPQSSVEVENLWSYTSIPSPVPSCMGVFIFLYFLSLNLSMQRAIFDVPLQLFSSSLPDLARINEQRRRHVIIWEQRSRSKGPGVRVGDNYLEKN